ncbi:MAG: tRNA 2-thiocytidine(32) synthetase TtcA [Synergistaceae bacterium]|jgi:tRNA(Ile)-lysidine synthase TilS/MesJ|nr:tRNA 2-thiocytidine(32) synthetase TtcA [Synergistaceae bacterium]
MGDARRFRLRKKIAKDIGRAIFDFSMIREGDKILVGLSGGKDSNLLLYALCGMRRRGLVRFDVEALTIDPAGGQSDLGRLREYVESLGAPFSVEGYPIFSILESRGGKSPCSLCANIRRGMLASAARSRGCNVLALGHHRDDAIETALMNLLYSGRFRSFHPHIAMSRSGVRVIRPLVYVPERDIAEENDSLALPRIDFNCKYAAASARARVKGLIRDLSGESRDVPGSIVHALKNCRESGSWSEEAEHGFE